MNDETPIQSLVEIPPHDALTVFATARKAGVAHPIDPILARVRSEIDDFQRDHLDVEKPDDRRRIGRMAYRVAQSKSALKKVGDDLAKEAKAIPGRIDATRRHVNDTLDAWRDEVRGPLTEWEAADEARKDRHKAAMGRLNALWRTPSPTAAETRQRLAEAETTATDDASCDEYAPDYRQAREAAISHLKSILPGQEKTEADRAELERLRKEADARQAAENAERLRKEGEDRARLEAEADAAAERARVRAETEKREAQHKAEVAELERKAVEAANRAKAEIEAKAKKEADDAALRESDKQHRAKVNRAALAVLVANGIGEESAKVVIKLIASKAVPNVSIHY